MDGKKGVVLVFATALISGISIFVNKFAVEGFNPYSYTFMKNIAVAFLFLVLIFAIGQYNKLKQLTSKQWLKLFLIGAFGGSIPFLLFFKGLSISSGATSAFIHKTLFIWVGLLAIIFLKERLHKGALIGAILLLIGNAFLLKLGVFSFDLGALLVLIATFFWAIETVISKHVLKDVSANIVAFARMGFGSIIVLIFLIATRNLPTTAMFSLDGLFWVLLPAIFLLGYVYTWYNGLSKLSASVATSILLLGSPITTLLSYLFLDTALAMSQVFGIIFLASGIGIVILFSRKNIHSSFSTAQA
ncbi:DMT family transporter [Candidatus Woesearchaeota archaeon]|nr:DMT family transporter [Candidatus Woesearchaeota archaeon]